MSGDGSVLGRTARGAADIAAELRREFDIALQARYGTQSQPDPVLATLFHALATQVAHVYQEAESVFPLAVLDDILSGIAAPPRLAQPAQLVAGFTGLTQRERLPLDTELVGTSQSGEQFGFTPDESIELAPAELRFAAVYEGGKLHTISGARVSKTGPFVLPGNTALDLGQAPPSLFLAIDTDAAHLSGLGMFLDVTPLDGPVARACWQSPWHLLDARGTVTEMGTLRARPGRGGVRRLEWLDAHVESAAGEFAEALQLVEGPYGTGVFVWPPVPEARRWRCQIPRAIAGAVERLLPAEQPRALANPLVWIQIPLPAGTASVSTSIQRIALNTITASNVEVVNEQIPFDRMGAVVTLEPEGKRGRYLMGLLSVAGEKGTRYAREGDLGIDLAEGRHRYRSGRLECRPARGPTGRYDAYALVRLLYCDGDAANGIAVNELKRIATPLANVTAKVANLTVSRGGAAPPAYPSAKLRFAELVRSRERVVTAADAEIAVKAFEPRVRAVEVVATSDVVGGRVMHGQAVTVRVHTADFADPDAELPRLRAQLAEHLQRRAVLGYHVTVDVAPAA